MRGSPAMMKLLGLGCLCLLLVGSPGCGGGNEPAASSGEASGDSESAQEAAAAPEETEETVVEVEPERARELVEQRAGLLVLDIRTPEEFQEGHIAGAKHVDYYGDGFEQKLQELEKDRPVLVHCASGGRSAQTRDLMRSLGFKKVYHFGGGMNAWKDAGYPIERPEGENAEE